jgi:L-methionine (R)-S-oxide reductase
MGMHKNAILKLREGFSRLSTDGSMQECLTQLSELTAAIVGARQCIILLLKEGEAAAAALCEEPRFGTLPGQFSGRGETRSHKEHMVCAIVLQGRTVGLIHACGPLHHPAFSLGDLHSFSVVMPLVARSIQVIQLQNILKSRFTQIALSRTDKSTICNLTAGIVDNPNQIARILAKSFYREMLNAGFNLNQILSAATEVISEITTGLRKHSIKHKERARRNGSVMDIIIAPSSGAALLQQRPEDGESSRAGPQHAD